MQMTEPSTTAATFAEYRPYLFGLAYRMMGSASDAEDIVQDAFVRWLQTGEGEEVQSPKAFLSTIVVRLCLDELRSARARREQYAGPWLPEPVQTAQREGPVESAMLRESLSYAFLIMLERLAPVERAVFVLREAFDYGYGEVATAVGKTEANCRQILHRAHRHLGDPHSRFDVAYEQQERLTEQFLRASSSGDLDGLLGLLTDDAILVADGGGKVAQAGRRPVHGARNVARGMVGGLAHLPAGLVARIEEVNGQPAVVASLDGYPFAVAVLEVDGDRVRGVYLVLNPDKLDGLGHVREIV